MNDSLSIIVYLAAAFVITRIPYVRTYLSICYTLLHEVIIVLVGGRTSKRIRLLKNYSSLETSDSPTFKHNLISYVSYTATILIAIGLFYLVSINEYYLILYILIGLMTISIVLWIRHFLDFLWALSFIALLALPLYFGYETTIMPTAIFLASYIMIQSILNALYVCRQIFLNRKRKGIAAKVKWIPSMILALSLLGQSLFAGYFVVCNFIYNIGLPWGNLEFIHLPWI
ncbi:M50 family metallopeptidase [Metabacillus fastidiosus]|uniref:M50 family metallopeptidase n=1 Tax=Metabacillus fastidiosus TaxID=1458 RepID=UPI000825B70E|nr:M50 family metallopeptidase [Metabacillus fastidiosus]MED4460709.1 M50 family metallopeptidase [Metabacillus fastidiosus]